MSDEETLVAYFGEKLNGLELMSIKLAIKECSFATNWDLCPFFK